MTNIDETIITYQTLDISKIADGLSSDASQANAIGAIRQTVDSIQPIEIVGQAPLEFVARLLVSLINIVPEIIYREKIDGSGVVITSTLPEGTVRPLEIFDPVRLWSDKDLSDFESAQNKDESKNVELILPNIILDELPKDDKLLKNFLKDVYQLNPHKERVLLQGENLSPLLITVVWFLKGESSNIIFNKIAL